MKKKLYRSSRQKVVSGVCGGLAEYLDMDVTIIRLLWVIAILIGVTGLLLYLIAAIIIPKDEDYDGTVVIDEDGNQTYVQHDRHTDSSTRSNSLLFLGGLLVILGILVLLDRFIPFRAILRSLRGYVWPLLLIVAGLAILLPSLKNRE